MTGGLPAGCSRRADSGFVATRGFAVGLAVITALGLGIRLVTLITVADRDPDGGDPFYYHAQANLLADGEGFADPFTERDSGEIRPTAVHPPGYTMWLATTSVFGARGYDAHKLASVAAGTLLVVAVGLLGRRLAGARAGLIAAGLAAVYPNLWVIDGILQPEGLFALAIAGVLLAATRWWDRPTLPGAAVVGGLVAVAALVRGEALFLGPLLAGGWLWHQRRDRGGEPALDWRRAAAGMGVAAGVGVLVLAPWMVRNLVTFDRFVPLSTNGNEVIYYANCEDSYGDELLGFWSFACQVDQRREEGQPPGDESERAVYWRDQGLAFAADHPGRVPAVVAARVGRVWDLYRPFQNAYLSQVEGRRSWVNRAGLFAYWALLPVAAAGVVAARRRGVVLWPMASVVIMVTVTAIYAYGVVRFRVPAEVVLVVLAGIGADRGIDLVGRWRKRHPGQSGGVGAAP